MAGMRIRARTLVPNNTIGGFFRLFGMAVCDASVLQSMGDPDVALHV